MHKVHSPFLDVGIQRLDTEDEAEGELRRQNFLQTATSEEEVQNSLILNILNNILTLYI